MKPFYKSRQFWASFAVGLSAMIGIVATRYDTLGLSETALTWVLLAQAGLSVVLVGLRLQDEKQTKARNNA